MSSILKALRKLEEEKAALGEGGVDLSRDILKRSARRQAPNYFWPVLSIVLFLLLVGLGIFSMTRVRTVSVPLQETSATAANPIFQPPARVSLPVAQVAPLVESSAPALLPAPVAEPPEEILKTSLVHVQTEPAALRPDGVPFLKLTGIAYRDNSAERMAIINDFPVMQGTAIEGAQLVEIHPDRVVLSWKGSLFDLWIEDDK